MEGTDGNIEKELPELPHWIKSAAKLLNSGMENQDWICLANHLGNQLPHPFDLTLTPLHKILQTTIYIAKKKKNYYFSFIPTYFLMAISYNNITI